MAVRAYLSTLSKRWPIERQEAEHATKTPGWPGDVIVYRDKLSSRALMAHSVSSLKERASLLRPSSRRDGEVIYVASLAVLAIGANDFMDVCAAALARGAAIVAHEDKVTILPNSKPEQMRDALAFFIHSKRRFERKKGEAGKAGAAASATKRAADAKRRVELIREDWGKRDVPMAELLKRAGRKIKGRRDVVPMSHITAARELGRRRDAQREHDFRLEQEARRRAESGDG
ncbi:MAG: hypothetical protein NVS1B6_15860 [Steroidobacteraceae bacterium]